MKYLYTLVILIIFSASLLFPQNGSFKLDYDTLQSASTNRISLDGYWKFKPGDDKQWALISYDDSKWDTVDNSLNLDSLKSNYITGNCWFRKTIQIDSTLYGKILGLYISQRGASEIYFDGKLIKKYGKVGTDIESEDTYNPSFVALAVNPDSTENHLIAIRYSYHTILSQSHWSGLFGQVAGFVLRVGVLNDSLGKWFINLRANIALNVSLFGLLFSLSLLHFLIYLFYRKETSNLYYSFFTLSMSLVFLSGHIISNSLNPDTFVYINIFQNILLFSLFIFLLTFLYTIYYDKKPKQLWFFVIIGAGILASTFIITSQYVNNVLFIIFIVLTILESLRIIIKAIRNKIHGSWIIGIGTLGFILLVAFVLVINIFLQDNIDLPQAFIIFILYAGFLSIPLSMSIYLARGFAKTNKDLSQKLDEVKELSRNAIEQEKMNADLKVQSEREKAKIRETELLNKNLQIENERKAKELEDARQLQLSMLPSVIPSLPNLDIAVYMQTATEVGGDYYDFHLSEDNTLTTVIGDATGHGVKAGVLVATVKSLFIHNAESDSLVMFNHFGESIKQMNFEKLFMCLLIAKIKGNKLQLASAGIPPVYIFRNESSSIEKIIQKGMPLGSFLDFPYEQKEFTLNSGDTILFMSDGFPEMHNDKREMFDYERVEETFLDIAKNSPKEIINKLNSKVKEWRNGNSPDDDVTFIVIKIK